MDKIDIVSISHAPYALPLAHCFRNARQTLDQREGWLLRIEDKSGAWGVGEAAPLPGFGMESLAHCAASLARWRRELPGSALPVPNLARALAGTADDVLANYRAGPAATHALEQALLDLAARRAGLPLAVYLSPKACWEVPCNALLSADAPEEEHSDADTAADANQALAQAAAAAVAEGFGTLKLKVGNQSPRRELERLRKVRKEVGPQIRLRIDANGSWNEAQARTLLEALAPLNIEYVEQPLPDVAGMARLAAVSPIPIAADESICSARDAKTLLTRRAAEVLVLKPMALGGLLSALRLAQLAAAEGVRVVLTTMLEGAYGRMGALHAAAVLRGILPETVPYAHGLATGHLLSTDVVAHPPQVRGGVLFLPPGSGLGLPAPHIPGIIPQKA